MGSGFRLYGVWKFFVKKMNSIMIDRYNKLAQFLIGQNKKKLIFDNSFSQMMKINFF